MATVLLNKSPQIDQQHRIEGEVRALVDLVLEGLGASQRPISIIWHGAFARGESGLYAYQDRWLPFGDYDLEVVCEEVPSADLIEQIENAITDRFGYRPVTAPVEETLVENATTFNVLDLKFSTREQFLNHSPDLATYDLIHSSQVLFGEDLPSQLSLDLRQVPRFSAYRILQNRLYQTLCLFQDDLWDPGKVLTHQEKVAYSLAICRLWLDFGMALSMCLDCYAADHQTRMRNIEQEGDKIALWFRDWKGLLDGIRVAIDFKKNPKPHALNARAIRHGYFLALESWDKVMRVVQAKMLPYHFGRDYELDKVDYWEETAETCLKVFPKLYYREYLQAMMKKETSPRKLDALALGANIFENYRFMGPGFLLKHPKTSLTSPEILYFACVPLMAYSITPIGKVHFGMLKQVMNLVAPYRKCDITLIRRSDWQKVKDFFVELFDDYRHSRGKARKLPSFLQKNK